MSARAHILEVATRHMAARGADASSLQAIADDVGIRKASILYHFPSKKALRQAVLEALLSRWNEVLPRLFIANSLTGVERFDAVMAELLSFFAEDGDRARLLVREQMDRPKEMEAYLLAFVKPWMEMVSRTLRAGQREGLIRPGVDPEAYVLTVVHMALSVFSNLRYSRTLLQGDNARDRGVQELLRVARVSLFSEGQHE